MADDLTTHPLYPSPNGDPVKEKVKVDMRNNRIRQLLASRFIKVREIARIDEELETLLKPEIDSLPY